MDSRLVIELMIVKNARSDIVITPRSIASKIHLKQSLLVLLWKQWPEALQWRQLYSKLLIEAMSIGLDPISNGQGKGSIFKALREREYFQSIINQAISNLTSFSNKHNRHTFFLFHESCRYYSLLRSEVKHHILHLYYRFGMQHRPEVTLYCWLALNLLVIHSFLTSGGSRSFTIVHSGISQPYKERGNKSALQRESVLCEMARGKAPSSPNHFFIRTFRFNKSKQASNFTLIKAKAIQ